MGRPLAFTRQRQDSFLQHLREGMARGAAADETFDSDDPERRRKVRDFIDENKDFEARVLDAEVEATEHIKEAMFQAAASGSVPAMKAFLDLYGTGVRRAQSAPHAPDQKPPVGDEGGPGDDLFNVTPIDPRRRRHDAS